MATYTESSMMSADEDSTSSPDDDPYDDTDILNSAGTDEVTAHLAAAGKLLHWCFPSLLFNVILKVEQQGVLMVFI